MNSNEQKNCIDVHLSRGTRLFDSQVKVPFLFLLSFCLYPIEFSHQIENQQIKSCLVYSSCLLLKCNEYLKMYSGERFRHLSTLVYVARKASQKQCRIV